MRATLINLWDKLAGSYWFVPAIIILAALVAASILPSIELDFIAAQARPDWLNIDPSSAQTILSTIAAIMATVVSLVFSLAILTLSIATSQFGPRLLRSFLNNVSTQVVLGTFVATVIYSMLVLAMVRDTESYAYVPTLAVYAAIAGAVGNLIYLIYFVNNIAELIQAPNVVARVAQDLDASVDRLFPVEQDGQPEVAADRDAILPEATATLCTEQEGYLQGVDIDALVEHAKCAGVVLRLHYRPGHFIYRSSPIATVHGARVETGPLESAVNQCIATGHRRTPRQDVECALAELVELAVRALSPGINDPFTAINVIDRIGASLGRAVTRRTPESQYRDEWGEVRLVMPATTFPDFASAGLDQLRQHARGNAAVLIRLLQALIEVARRAHRPADAHAVLRHVEMIVRTCESSIEEPNDLNDIQDQVAKIQAELRRFEALTLPDLHEALVAKSEESANESDS